VVHKYYRGTGVVQEYSSSIVLQMSKISTVIHGRGVQQLYRDGTGV
jgi:hypothetical protein